MASLSARANISVYRRSVTSADLDSLKGIDVESVINLKVFSFLSTALIYSVKEGDIGIVKFLLKVDGIDVNAVDNVGRSALHWAADSGSQEAVRLLLKMPEIQVEMNDEFGNIAQDLADSETASIIQAAIITNLKKTLEDNKAKENVNVEETMREMPRFGKRKLKSTIEIFQSKRRGYLKEVEKLDGAIDGMKECLEEIDPGFTLQEAKKDFECPICFEDMEPPKEIWQCEGGHTICGTCKDQPTIKNCPTCSRAIGGRNRAMENLYLALF